MDIFNDYIVFTGHYNNIISWLCFLGSPNWVVRLSPISLSHSLYCTSNREPVISLAKIDFQPESFRLFLVFLYFLLSGKRKFIVDDRRKKGNASAADKL